MARRRLAGVIEGFYRLNEIFDLLRRCLVRRLCLSYKRRVGNG
jgi:hypothetical protein